MSGYIDLHCHTTCSDGTDSPWDLVERAKELGLAAVAVTDHDIFRGYKEAQIAGAEFGVEIVPGVELSSVYGGKHIHLLAYYADMENQALRSLMDRAVRERIKRNKSMVRRMQEAGYPISWEELSRRHAGNVMLGRPHVAEILMEKGIIASIEEGVTKLMGRGGPFFVERYHVPLLDYVRAVREAGGVPVIAHLYQYKMQPEALRQMISDAVGAGLMGLEGMYSTYTPEQEAEVRALAKEFCLIRTGGSDYHGTRKPKIHLGTGLGNLAVPYELLEDLKKAAERA